MKRHLPLGEDNPPKYRKLQFHITIKKNLTFFNNQNIMKMPPSPQLGIITL